ncbi:hypothetical protein ACVIGA_001760 [Bradyrhizobium sp. USDA 3240]
MMGAALGGLIGRLRGRAAPACIEGDCVARRDRKSQAGLMEIKSDTPGIRFAWVAQIHP